MLVPQLITVGVICRETGEPLHRVLNILATRPHIRPAARAGNVRLFDESAIAQVRHELNAIDAQRASRSGSRHEKRRNRDFAR